METENTVSAAKPPFNPDAYDLAFALATFVLGYLFSRWVFFTWHGWGVSAFTAAYLFSVSAYLVKKGAVITMPAMFWCAVTLITGASFALWSANGLFGLRPMFLFCSAVYYALTLSGRAILGKTSDYLLLDGLNAVVVIPFRNFASQYLSFKVLRRSGKSVGHRWPVALGIALALMLIAMLFPLLERADSGGFSQITGFIREISDAISERFAEILFYAAFSIPMAAYIYGLASGCAHRRYTGVFTPEKTDKAVRGLRVLPPVTILITLCGLLALYLIFVLCQIPYFFSAFTGSRPDGFLVYSEYARRGFFELCQIAAINLAVITAGNIASRRHRRDFTALRALNIAFALVTLLLIATAFSKMALYIDAYGLSMLRLLPCVFMAFLTVVLLALIALQWKRFSIIRFALVTGSVMMCALCVINPDALVARYNADRFLAGTLRTCDVEIFERAGHAGVIPAVDVLNATGDPVLKAQLKLYLECLPVYDGNEICYETQRAIAAIVN